MQQDFGGFMTIKREKNNNKQHEARCRALNLIRHWDHLLHTAAVMVAGESAPRSRHGSVRLRPPVLPPREQKLSHLTSRALCLLSGLFFLASRPSSRAPPVIGLRDS